MTIKDTILTILNHTNLTDIIKIRVWGRINNFVVETIDCNEASINAIKYVIEKYGESECTNWSIYPTIISDEIGLLISLEL